MLPPKWSYPSHLRNLFEKPYGSLRVKTINMLGCFAHKDVTLLSYWSEFVYRQCLYVMCAKMNNFLLSKTWSYTQQNRKYVQFSSGIKQNFFIYILWIYIYALCILEKNKHILDTTISSVQWSDLLHSSQESRKKWPLPPFLCMSILIAFFKKSNHKKAS